MAALFAKRTRMLFLPQLRPSLARTTAISALLTLTLSSCKSHENHVYYEGSGDESRTTTDDSGKEDATAGASEGGGGASPGSKVDRSNMGGNGSGGMQNMGFGGMQNTGSGGMQNMGSGGMQNMGSGGMQNMGGMGTGGDVNEPINPFAADWARLDQQPTNSSDLNQCIGFVSGTQVYQEPNANPKDEDPCSGAGNTQAMDGSCNVPFGFERRDTVIGNRSCSCNVALGLDCSTALLPGIVLQPPSDCGGLAEVIDETPCGAEFETCMAYDIPGACEYTTPKGCVCLENAVGDNVWQCGSTNSWFDCGGGIACPAAWPANLTSGADIKTNCNNASCGGSPACE